MNKVGFLCVSVVNAWHQNNPYTVELVIKLIILSSFFQNGFSWGERDSLRLHLLCSFEKKNELFKAKKVVFLT